MDNDESITALATLQDTPLSVDEIMAQVGLIQQVMARAMQQDVHYGVIPGCGDKPALLKPGAEKLCLTFRLRPESLVEFVDLPHGHKEYRVRVKIYSRSGGYMGDGVGSCSTMEAKYRYRTGPVEFTDKPVPKEYWDLRKSDPGKAKALLGGPGFVTKKNEAGAWVIARQGDKVEHDNPADHFNTCEKMAKKRALVDAILTVTAASDIFTQDLEEMVDEPIEPKKTNPVQSGKEAGQDTAEKAPKSVSEPRSPSEPTKDTSLPAGQAGLELNPELLKAQIEAKLMKLEGLTGLGWQELLEEHSKYEKNGKVYQARTMSEIMRSNKEGKYAWAYSTYGRIKKALEEAEEIGR